MKKPDILENRAKVVLLGIGSNLGNRYFNIEKAKYLLNSNEINLIKCSNYYETHSWPDNRFPKYLNIIILFLAEFWASGPAPGSPTKQK